MYAKYIDIPNWKKIRDQIITFRYTKPLDRVWWCYFEDEIKKEIPDLIESFESIGLHMRQMILFTTFQNDFDIKDSMDPKAIFAHTDEQDDPDSPHDKVPVLTNFVPTYAINIPLENCEESITLWYKIKDAAKDGVYYPKYNCGGHDLTNVEELHRFELDKPAILKIDTPHGVYNPHKADRTVATFRFYEDIEYLIKD